MHEPEPTPQDSEVFAPFAAANVIDDDDMPESRPSSGREGLPSSYRMRADAHYVDLLASGASSGREQLLDARSIECHDVIEPEVLAPLVASFKAHGVLQPLIVQGRGGRYRVISGRRRLKAAVAAGLRKVPCFVHDVDDEAAAALAAAARVQAGEGTAAAAQSVGGPGEAESAALLAQSLKTLSVCATLVPAEAGDLPTATAGHLLRAELWRATCLVQAMRLVRDELPIAVGPVTVRKVVERAVQELAAEQRLRGFEIETAVEVPDGATVLVDESVMTAAIGSAVLAMVPLLNGAAGRFTIRVADGPAGFVTVRVSQSSVRASESWANQAFDDTWNARPGGTAARMSMLAIAAAARSLSGRVAIEAGARGTSVAISVPPGRPRVS